MNFGEAFNALESGKKVAREGWNGKGMWVEIQKPDANSKMTKPYFFMNLPNGSTNHFGDNAHPKLDRVPWQPSQTDIFAKDWQIVI